MKRSICAIFFVVAAVSVIFAQVESTPNSNAVPRDCREGYKNWLKKDVAYIITSEEKKAFNALKTDEERENFIENFWRRRDPKPDTEENEFRAAYYERIAYTNENFAFKIPGWMTDRGRIYITWGKPEKIEKGYAAFEENMSAAYEKWFYGHVPKVGYDVEVTFADPAENGEFRLFTTTTTQY